MDRRAVRNGIGVINVIDRSAATGIVEPRAEGAGGQTWIVNRDPVVAGQDIIGGERILRGAAASIEGVHLEPITGSLHRDKSRVRGGDQRRAVMGERSGIV